MIHISGDHVAALAQLLHELFIACPACWTAVHACRLGCKSNIEPGREWVSEPAGKRWGQACGAGPGGSWECTTGSKAAAHRSRPSASDRSAWQGPGRPPGLCNMALSHIPCPRAQPPPASAARRRGGGGERQGVAAARAAGRPPVPQDLENDLDGTIVHPARFEMGAADRQVSNGEASARAMQCAPFVKSPSAQPPVVHAVAGAATPTAPPLAADGLLWGRGPVSLIHPATCCADLLHQR